MLKVFLEKMKAMTSKDKDWIDEVLEDEICGLWQIGIIEQLLITSGVNYLYENIDFNTLTANEAENIIKDLQENNCPKDPKEQYKIMQRKGVFK